jgi:excisionase family DNA binding protein
MPPLSSSAAAARGSVPENVSRLPESATHRAHAAYDEPLLLTVDETASFLRTTRKAVYALIERGQLAGVVRLGRRVLVRRDQLLSSLTEKRTASPGRTRR